MGNASIFKFRPHVVFEAVDSVQAITNLQARCRMLKQTQVVSHALGLEPIAR